MHLPLLSLLLQPQKWEIILNFQNQDIFLKILNLIKLSQDPKNFLLLFKLFFLIMKNFSQIPDLFDHFLPLISKEFYNTLFISIK